MMFVRLYSGQDGQSHFEELDIREGSPLFSKTHPGVEVVFKNNPPSQSVEWHTAPRRRYLITLSGSVDVRIGDGTVKTFGPGDVFLAEDLTGQGHTITPKGASARTSLTVKCKHLPYSNMVENTSCR